MRDYESESKQPIKIKRQLRPMTAAVVFYDFLK